MTDSPLQAKMTVELKCRMTECPFIEKEADNMTNAIELMKFHMFSEHGQGGGSCQKMERPMISRGVY